MNDIKAERLQRTNDVHHIASEAMVGEPKLFIAECCGEDVKLRREVESLISFEADSGNFLDAAPEALAEIFLEQEKALNLAGKQFSRYRIKKLLGRSGMGEVYPAKDTKLDRRVAVKFPNEELSQDADELNRLIQEAKAASTLNLPNILAVYEISEADGENYVAAESVDGETLCEYFFND